MDCGVAPSGVLRYDRGDKQGSSIYYLFMPYYVYIMASKRNGTLYTGVTNDLQRRVFEHKEKQKKGFTEKYSVTRLVHFAETDDVRSAIEREKQIKSWSRSKKISLIEESNPEWSDLAAKWNEKSLSLP